MEITFISKQHEERYNELVERNGKKDTDRNTRQFFYTIAGIDDLWNARDTIFDFNQHWFKRKFTGRYLSTTAYRIYRHSLHLFNDFYKDIPTTDLCMGLDLNHQLLVVNAMCIYMECGTVYAREKSKYEKMFESSWDETSRGNLLTPKEPSNEKAE
jgi:hypothetical protein